MNWEKVQRSVQWLRMQESRTPRLGIVAGSGLGLIAESVDNPRVIPYGKIPDFPLTTVAGHQGVLVIGEMSGQAVAVLQGRVHLYEGHEPAEVVHAVCTLAAWGAHTVILTNASGAINQAFRPGMPMIMTDHLNLTGRNPLTGPHEATNPWSRFPDMSRVYDAQVNSILEAAFVAAAVEICHGVYAGLPGPSYETPAEIRMLRTLGADAVGMSTVLEAIALHAMGVRVGCISMPANWAAGLLEGQTLEHSDVLRVLLETTKRVGPVLVRAAGQFVTQ